MKTIVKTGLLSAMITLSACAHGTETPKSAMGMDCSMTADASDMRENMGSMMMDMRAMMGATSDSAMKARMQKMHDQMALMMATMKKMGGGKGSMMQGGEAGDSSAPTEPPPAADGHSVHH